jgi:DNA polymerase III delta prime subunit
VKSVLGDEILQYQATSHITFNPIAKTIMLRGLQEFRSFRKLPKSLLQSVVEISAGDIRSAINCLTLIAIQLHYSPNLIRDKSMYDYSVHSNVKIGGVGMSRGRS